MTAKLDKKRGNYTDITSLQSAKSELLKFVEELKAKNQLSNKQIVDLFEGVTDKLSSNTFPISLLSNRTLGVLETIVKYLKENSGYSNHEMGEILSRDDRTIWGSYKKAVKKSPNVFSDIKESPHDVPLSLLQNSKLGMLEVVVKYLKENRCLSNHEIGRILGRDDRTIWGTYDKACKKDPSTLTVEQSAVKEPTIDDIPLNIFANKDLGILESLTKYLKENLELSNNEIADLLSRDNRTIWGAYSKAVKKFPKPVVPNFSFTVPLTIFKDRSKGTLESLSVYLKDECKLTFAKIGERLGRDQRTIWTVYTRAKKKK